MGWTVPVLHDYSKKLNQWIINASQYGVEKLVLVEDLEANKNFSWKIWSMQASSRNFNVCKFQNAIFDSMAL